MEVTKDLIRQYFNVTDDNIRLCTTNHAYEVNIFYPLPLGYYGMEPHEDFGLVISLDSKEDYLQILIECGIEPYVIYGSDYTEEKPPEGIVPMLVFAREKVRNFGNVFIKELLK